MVPTSIETTLILLLAIAPGYFATKNWYRARTWEGFRSDLELVLRSLAVSLLIQVPLFPLAVWWALYPDVSHEGQHALLLAIWLLLAVVVLPVIGGFVLGSVYEYYFGSEPDPHKRTGWRGVFSYMGARTSRHLPPTVWDQFFLYQVPSGCALVIEFDDGTRVAGNWEYPAVARTSPDQPGLFLPLEWVLDEDGDLLHPLPASRGILLPNTDRIRKIRVLKWEGKSSEDLPKEPEENTGL